MFQPRKRSVQVGGKSKKVKLVSSMDEPTILRWIIKIKQENHITSIGFDDVRLTPSIVAAMVDLFRSTSRYGRIFEKLSIEFCDGFGADLIVTAALMMDAIKQLFLATDRPRDDLLCRLATTLRINTSLSSLWLLVPLTETSAIALADTLRDNETLEIFSLSGSNFDKPEEDDEDNGGVLAGTKSDSISIDTADLNFFSPMETAAALCEGLRENIGLRKVNLSCCYLEDDSLSLLVQSLVGHPSLRTLDISRNSARKQTMLALADVVGMESCVLTTLDIREQSDKEPLDISDFARAMKGNTSIETLRLSHNQLEDAQIIDLINQLQDNNAIQELDLQYNQLTEIGVNYLTEHLSGLKSLAVLLLGGNAFGEECLNTLENLEEDEESICTITEKGPVCRKPKDNGSERKAFIGKMTTFSSSSTSNPPRGKGLTSKFPSFSGFIGNASPKKKFGGC